MYKNVLVHTSCGHKNNTQLTRGCTCIDCDGAKQAASKNWLLKGELIVSYGFRRNPYAGAASSKSQMVAREVYL